MSTINSPTSPVNKSRVFSKLVPGLQKLHERILKEAAYEPPEAYWRGLWDKLHLPVRQTKATIQVQGSVVRVKSRRPNKQERGATFERHWDEKPWMWGDDFLMVGYDRFNPHDNAIFGAKRRKGNKSDVKEFSGASRRNLMDKMCSLLLEVWLRAWFVTLTYHNSWPDPRGAKAHLRAFY